jgi:23S rRNA (uracil1939-C5)-methyltransferase
MRPSGGRRPHGGGRRARGHESGDTSGGKVASGARLEGVVERYVPGGLGVVRVEGRVHLVAGALLGERVEFESGAPRARLLRVIEASGERVEAPCAHVDACGGCDFMRFSAGEQARAHAEIVRELVAHVMADRALPEIAVVPAPRPLGYRTRARLAFRAGPKSVVVGYRRERSRDIAAIDRCVVLDERLEPALAIARDVLAASSADEWGRGERSEPPSRGSPRSSARVMQPAAFTGSAARATIS